MAESETDFVPVADAATAAGVPVRSLYRWITARRLHSVKRGGATVVDPAAVQALAANRETAKRPGNAGAIVGTSVGNGATVANGSPLKEGDLAADAFSRFEAGASPIEVVQAMRVAPERVRAWHRDWLAMKEPAGPSAAERLSALEDIAKRLAQQVADLGSALDWVQLTSLPQLEARLSSLPVPTADAFVCPSCAAQGLLAVRVQCTNCRGETAFGFHPQ